MKEIIVKKVVVEEITIDIYNSIIISIEKLVFWVKYTNMLCTKPIKRCTPTFLCKSARLILYDPWAKCGLVYIDFNQVTTRINRRYGHSLLIGIHCCDESIVHCINSKTNDKVRYPRKDF